MKRVEVPKMTGKEKYNLSAFGTSVKKQYDNEEPF